MRAVLAGEAIAPINILSRKFQTRGFPGIDVFFKAHDAWEAETCGGTARREGMILKNFDFALEPQQKRSLPAHEFYRLVADIQNKRSTGAFSAPRTAIIKWIDMN